jgi:hypothetical protein
VVFAVTDFKGICLTVMLFHDFFGTQAFLFIFLKDFIYLLYISTLQLSSDIQERILDLITDGCEPPCGCWDLNSRPLEEEPSL